MMNNQTKLFELSTEKRQLPEIYTYQNLSINRKMNYKSAPMFLYGSQHITTIEIVYGSGFAYGLNRTGLDYSLKPHEDLRK